MPIQDNEQPKKADEFFENDEDKRRQAVQASQESNVGKSQKLLPFLNAKAEFHQSRIDNINEKIATRENKIAKNEAKIEKLTAKADKLEDRNTMLKNTLGNVTVVRKLIESNEKRIDKIRNEKILNRIQKIVESENKIGQLTVKKERIEHKLDRVLALNNTIKSFSIGNNKERREIFADAMDRLNAANTDCLIDKLNVLQEQKSKLSMEYSNPENSAVDKYNMQKKIENINEKISVLGDKINKLTRSENHFSEQPDNAKDNIIKAVSDKIGEITDNDEIGITDISENIIETAESIESDKNITAEKFNPLENAEIQLEDDANMIDGIINNGSKEDLLKTQKELSETLDAMKDIAGNKYMMQSIREDTIKEIPKITAQLGAVNKALEKFAPAVEDKGIINPDYYKFLPKEQRHIESMSNRQAEKVISALTAAEVKFSAVHRANDKTAVTVAESDTPILKAMMTNAQKAMEEESRQAWHSLGDAFIEAYEEIHVPENIEFRKPETTTINPDFYKSLTKDNRSISVETKENADKIMGQLENKGIQFSASIRKNDTVAITVAKADENAYKNISDSIKSERAKQIVNPDFFKALPKEERATQRMTQAEAENKITELSAKGIPHSAVLNGDKSAVTVEKKNVGAAFVSRNTLKKSAQRISSKSKQQERQKTPNKNHGIE